MLVLHMSIFMSIRANDVPASFCTMSAKRSCGKIDARVFEQFSNLSGFFSGHNQMEIIYER